MTVSRAGEARSKQVPIEDPRIQDTRDKRTEEGTDNFGVDDRQLRALAREEMLGLVRTYIVGLDDSDLAVVAGMASPFSRRCTEIPGSIFSDHRKLRALLLETVDTLDVEALVRFAHSLEEKGYPRLGQPTAR
jgi:hypothetical protein